MRGAAMLLLASAIAWGQDWPQFRGPDGQGHSAVVSLPVTWGDTSKNIKWRVPVDGLGWSSPVVAGEHLWLTTATEGGKSLRALCLEVGTGQVVHNVEVFHVDAPGHLQSKNSYASPTPILEKDRVYVHFGTYGTACLTDKGALVWKQVVKWNDVHGPGGSPALVGDHLIFTADGLDAPFVIALDKKTGTMRWKTPRDTGDEPKKFAFCTPLAIEVGKTQQVVCPGAGGVTSYDPATGKGIWTVKYPRGYSVVPRPVYGHGLVYLSSGFDRPAFLAIRPDGKGDVTETHVAWKYAARAAPKSPSPLLVGDELYLVSDDGFAACLDARTGRVHWEERLGGNYSASPLNAAGMIYFQTETGVTHVIKSGTTFARIAKNEVKGRTLATLTPIEGTIFLRTDTQLLRIEAEPK